MERNPIHQDGGSFCSSISVHTLVHRRQACPIVRGSGKIIQDTLQFKNANRQRRSKI